MAQRKRVTVRKCVVESFGNIGKGSMFYNRRMCMGWFPGK